MSQARRVFAVGLRNRELRRVELAFLAFNAAEWGVWIAMLVYSYGRGGATTAGLVALAQLVPASIVAPVAAGLGDRYAPGRMLAFSYVAQAIAMAATASVLYAGATPYAAYACAALAATAVTLTRPAQATLLPALARTPDELTAANVLSGWVESTSVLAAPAATGVLLAVSSPGTVFAVMAALGAAAAVVVAPIRGPAPASARPPGTVSPGGYAVLARDPGVRLIAGVLGAQFVAIGALDVLYVVLAVAQLGRDGSWAGYLNAAFGAGGMAGVAVTATFVGRKRLAPPLLAGGLTWAGAFLLLAAVPSIAAALVLLACAGAGRTVVDVAGRTLLQRTAPPAALARVFGVLEAAAAIGLALGSLLTPALVALGGPRTALVGLAALLLAAALAAGRQIAQLDARATVPVVEIALLRSVPMLAPLDPPTIESLARSLEPVEAAPGDELIRQGDPGDRFYVIAEGELDVLIDGVLVNTAARGEGVGALALLADVPRTATVVARTPVRAYALEREPFLLAVTGNARSAAVAARVVRELLPEPASR